MPNQLYNPANSTDIDEGIAHHKPRHTSYWPTCVCALLGTFAVVLLLVKSFGRIVTVSDLPTWSLLAVTPSSPTANRALSDTTDAFYDFSNRDFCPISSLNIHTPVVPQCNDRASVLRAMTGGGRIGFDAPFRPRDCDMRWYSTNEACEIMSRFEQVMIVGDSLNRHLVNALYIMLRSDLALGGIREWDIETLIKDKHSISPTTRDWEDPATTEAIYTVATNPCRCRTQFYKSCSKLVVSDSDWIKGNDSATPLKCTAPLRLTYHPLKRWPLTQELLDEFIEKMPEQKPEKPVAIVLDHALWNDVNLTETTWFIDQVMGEVRRRVRWTMEDVELLESIGADTISNDAGDINDTSNDIVQPTSLIIPWSVDFVPWTPYLPKLFVTPSAGGHLKAPDLLATQSMNRLFSFEKKIEPIVRGRRGFEFLGMWNMSIQSSSPDGTHPTMETSLLKAQMVLNWLDRLETP